MKKALAMAVIVAASLVLGAGIAWASIPGPDGVIYGCYKTSNPGQGAVVVVDSAASCPAGTTPLKWAKDVPSQLYVKAAVVNESGYASVPPGQTVTLTAHCNSGDRAVSGGYEALVDGARVHADTPSFNDYGDPPLGMWTVTAKNENPSLDMPFNVYVICARSIS